MREIVDAETERARAVAGRSVVFRETAKTAIIGAARSVSELAEIVDAAIASSAGAATLGPADVAAAIERTRSKRSGESGLVGRTFEQIRKAALVETLNVCGGNRAQTARMLGVSGKTIRNWLREFRVK